MMTQCKLNLESVYDAGHGFSNKKILVLDDEPFNCEVVRQWLEQAQFEGCKEDGLDIFYEGELALKAVKESLRKWDASGLTNNQLNDSVLVTDRYDCDYGLIVTDLKMPGMDGYEFVERVQDLLDVFDIPAQNRPKIITITGHVENHFIEMAINSGFDQVLGKPCDPDEVLMSLVEKKLKFTVKERLREKILEYEE